MQLNFHWCLYPGYLPKFDLGFVEFTHMHFLVRAWLINFAQVLVEVPY